MKNIIIITFAVIVAPVCYMGGFKDGSDSGFKKAKNSLPSCIYLYNPRIKPLGYDGKKGVDLPHDEISGGGIYVSLEPLKMYE